MLHSRKQRITLVPQMSIKPSSSAQPVIIKKYANRRLYNTSTSSYVTLENLSLMIRDGEDFIVYDAKTNEDITRSVLTQIIVEEEQKGENLLPIGFLRQIIGLYGHNMQWMVPPFLETAMKVFARQQEQIKHMPSGFSLFGMGSLEELRKRNIAMFERAMKMWTLDNSAEPAESEELGEPEPSQPSVNETIRELTQRLDALQGQLNQLATRKDQGA